MRSLHPQAHAARDSLRILHVYLFHNKFLVSTSTFICSLLVFSKSSLPVWTLPTAPPGPLPLYSMAVNSPSPFLGKLAKPPLPPPCLSHTLNPDTSPFGVVIILHGVLWPPSSPSMVMFLPTQQRAAPWVRSSVCMTTGRLGNSLLGFPMALSIPALRYLSC